MDEELLRQAEGQAYDRAHRPFGLAHHIAASMAAGCRSERLGRVQAPTVVIHGTADRLVAPSGGEATARAIPGAALVLIEGLGHDLPEGAWPQIVQAIAHNARPPEPR